MQWCLSIAGGFPYQSTLKYNVSLSYVEWWYYCQWLFCYLFLLYSFWFSVLSSYAVALPRHWDSSRKPFSFCPHCDWLSSSMGKCSRFYKSRKKQHFKVHFCLKCPQGSGDVSWIVISIPLLSEKCLYHFVLSYSILEHFKWVHLKVWCVGRTFQNLLACVLVPHCLG